MRVFAVAYDTDSDVGRVGLENDNGPLDDMTPDEARALARGLEAAAEHAERQLEDNARPTALCELDPDREGWCAYHRTDHERDLWTGGTA